MDLPTHALRTDRPKAGSKLPAANSRSASTECHGASGNLFSAGVLSVVCGFSSKLDVKKMAGEEKDCAKDVKLRNHFVSNRFFLILVKSEGKNAIKLEKLKDCVEKHEN